MKLELTKEMNTKLDEILDIRSMLKNGKDKDGNRPTYLALEILKECERDLGKMVADRYTKKDME